MSNIRVLYICPEVMPFLPETHMSTICRHLPQAMQEGGHEIRLFMPRYGCINERRHQLHEVIRLSGMNLIIDDMDRHLIIKVASIPGARMQVYFIDSDDYFERKGMYYDEDEELFEDNDERAMFFVRGVLETVKKLRWTPDIIHCHGWFANLAPIYVKKVFSKDPIYKKAKIVLSLYNDQFEGELSSRMKEKIRQDGIKVDELSLLDKPNYTNLYKFALNNSDAAIIASEDVSPELKEYVKELDMPKLHYYDTETFIPAYSDFYESILEK